VAYGGAVALRHNWAQRIRSANIGLALVTLGLIVVWLSPLLVPERIAVRDQLARYEAGTLTATDLPLQEMAQRWGVAGSGALEMLREDPELMARIDELEEMPVPVPQDLRADIVARLPVTGADTLREAQLDDIEDAILIQWLQACDRAVTGGPGCALVFGDFKQTGTRDAAILLLRTDDGRVISNGLALANGRLQFRGYTLDLRQGGSYDMPVSVLEAVHSGTARIAPPAINALIVGDHALFLHN
jgi:hypothetical protein